MSDELRLGGLGGEQSLGLRLGGLGGQAAPTSPPLDAFEVEAQGLPTVPTGGEIYLQGLPTVPTGGDFF